MTNIPATVTIDTRPTSAIAERAQQILAKQQQRLADSTALVANVVLDELEKRAPVPGAQLHTIAVSPPLLQTYATDKRLNEAVQYGLHPYFADDATFAALAEGVRTALGEAFSTVIVEQGNSCNVRVRLGMEVPTAGALVPVDGSVATAITTQLKANVDNAAAIKAKLRAVAKTPEMKAVWALILAKKGSHASLKITDGVYLRPDGKVVGRYNAPLSRGIFDNVRLADIDAAVSGIYAAAHKGALPDYDGLIKILWFYKY